MGRKRLMPDAFMRSNEDRVCCMMLEACRVTMGSMLGPPSACSVRDSKNLDHLQMACSGPLRVASSGLNPAGVPLLDGQVGWVASAMG